MEFGKNVSSSSTSTTVTTTMQLSTAVTVTPQLATTGIVIPQMSTLRAATPTVGIASYATTVTTSSSMSQGMSNIPLNVFTVITPMVPSDISLKVTTINAIGHADLMGHLQQIQQGLHNTFWRPRTSSMPASVVQPSSSTTPQKRVHSQMSEPKRKPWTPTSVQKEIMKDMHQRNRGQLPTWEESVQVAMMLREHGEINAYNVFHWFRNYKYRETQKALRASASQPVTEPLSLFPQHAENIFETGNPQRTMNTNLISVEDDACNAPPRPDPTGAVVGNDNNPTQQ